MEQQQLQHFSHPEHPLVFNQDDRRPHTCRGCQEVVHRLSYSCKECSPWETIHHKSCAKLTLGLHHPLHPIRPLILFDEKTHYPEQEEEDKEKAKCQLCNESRRQYTYWCYCCDFNLDIKCASLAPIDPCLEVDHLHLWPLRQKRQRYTLSVSSMWFLDSWKMFYVPTKNWSCASQAPPPPHPFFSWIPSIWLPILSNLCEEIGHTLWVLLLLQMRLCCPPWLWYEDEMDYGLKFSRI